MPQRVRVPALLIPWEPWHRVFLDNLRYAFSPQPAPIYLTSKPAAFWPDVFVHRPAPYTTIAESIGVHVVVGVLVWVITWAFVIRPQTATVVEKKEKLTYYDVTEYLPPMSSGSAPAPKAQKGDPAYAKQEIVSLPPKPDNRIQTIVDPMNPRLLNQEVKIPNIVVWTPVPAPVPVAAAARGISQLAVPGMRQEVVPPAPDATRNLSSLTFPKLPAPSVVAPPPTPEMLERKIGDINIGLGTPSVAAPALPTPVQRASALGEEEGATNAAAPPPSASLGQGSGAQAMGQLIALGIRPSMPTGPIELPGGNRRGEFAAGPTGRPGGAGTPDKACCGTGPGGTGTGEGGPGSGAGANPSGVHVGAGPYNPGAGVQGDRPYAGATGAPGGPANGGGPGSRSNLRDLMARAAAPTNPADIPRETSPGSTVDRGSPSAPSSGKIEDYVFGPKKYYQITINMPNLTSAGGSWIIRFAELKQSPGSQDLTAPVATRKVDPAYPPDLIKARVEGTVQLYAVIRADGTVGEVRVLRGLDERLDENAIKAMQRWVFRPATKAGAPVDLEAVVTIPFAVRKTAFGY